MSNPTVLTRYRSRDGADFEKYSEVPAPGVSRLDSQGLPIGVSLYECMEQFHLLPAAAAAATAAPHLLTLGIGTEVAARAVKGGVNLKTQSSTPADDDNAMLVPAAATSGMTCVINASSQARFAARILLTLITAEYACFGLSELFTDPDPTATAGEGALFLFDPTQAVTTGLTAAQHANWILAHKVNGADTFTATDIPVLAATDYELIVALGSDFKARFYVNGALVGTGPALTDGDTVGAFLGIETTEGVRKDFEARFVGLSRMIG